MITHKTKCFRCPHIRILPENILKIMAGQNGKSGKYYFLCPNCNIKQSRPLDLKTYAVLKAAGIPEIIDKNVITEEEIETFMQKLDQEDAIGKFIKRNEPKRKNKFIFQIIEFFKTLLR